jgi:hypothetical protein
MQTRVRLSSSRAYRRPSLFFLSLHKIFKKDQRGIQGEMAGNKTSQRNNIESQITHRMHIDA